MNRLNLFTARMAACAVTATIALTTVWSTAHAASLRTITDVWGGSGNGNIPQGCTVFGPIPVLGSFFNGGGFRVQGGNVACGYVGVTADLTAASGPLLSQQTLAPVPLDGVGSSFQGAAGARASYGSLGVSASGVQVGGSSGTSATYSAGAALFQDTLTASSPLVAPSAPGFVRYVFRMDGSLFTPAGQGGGASVQLNIQQAGGQNFGLGRLQVQSGDPAIFSAIDGSPAGWTLGVGSISGAGTFGSTVHVPFFGDVDLPMNWGSPWDLTVGLLAQSQHTANASFMASAQLVDIQLFDAAHQRINDFSLSAASGTNYLAPVPEPASGALVVVGLLAVGGWARRRRHFAKSAAAAAVTMLPLLGTTPAIAAVQFSVTNLGTLGGATSTGFALNASGQVAGSSYLPNTASHAFVWSNGVMQDLGTLGGAFSNAYGINDAGQVAGDSYLANGSFTAVRWGANGTPQNLGDYPGSPGYGTSANAINNSGVVVGYSAFGTTAVDRPVRWRPGVAADLLVPLNANDSRALGINAAGVAVGISNTLPVMWSANGTNPRALPLLAGASFGVTTGINDAGEAVGNVQGRAVLWRGTGVLALGSISGATGAAASLKSYAYGINARGEVVGSSEQLGNAQLHGFLWSGGTMIDLNAMLAAGSGATVTDARAVNMHGQIAGNALINGAQRAVLLTPTGSVNWQAESGGSFADATNWEQSYLPSKFVDASISSVGLQTITVNAEASVKNLSLGSPAGSAGRPTLWMQGGAAMQVAGLLTVQATGTLAGDGTVAGNVINRGTVLPTNLTVTGSFNNQGLIAGSGTLNAALNNDTTGQVRSVAGDTLHVLGSGHVNAGTIDLSGGGQQHYAGTLTNTASGRILLNNATLRMDNGVTNGLRNAGQVQVSYGGATVYGNVTTQAGGKVILSGRSDTTFFDAVAVESGGELRVSNGASAVFFGLVTQRTGSLFTGTGTKFYEGGLSVGASPGLGVDEGSVNFGVANLYTAELGGTTACTAACAIDAALRDHSFDKYVVAGHLALGGTLKLVSWAGFTGQVGQSFDLLDWGSSSGSFSSIDASGLTLADGAVLDLSALYTSGVVSITAVPEPGSWALMLGGLGAAAMRFRQQRRSAARADIAWRAA
jgi:probable HAF family extracellular repeat protein